MVIRLYLNDMTATENSSQGSRGPLIGQLQKLDHFIPLLTIAALSQFLKTKDTP
jgi:hypothetical protein